MPAPTTVYGKNDQERAANTIRLLAQRSKMQVALQLKSSGRDPSGSEYWTYMVVTPKGQRAMQTVRKIGDTFRIDRASSASAGIGGYEIRGRKRLTSEERYERRGGWKL